MPDSVNNLTAAALDYAKSQGWSAPNTTTAPPAPAPSPAAEVPPPTSGARLLVTPALLARWRRMVSEGHWLMAWALKAASGAQSTLGPTWAWQAVAYGATADPKYAAAGIPAFLSALATPPANPNDARDRCLWPITYSLFLPAMSADQQATAVVGLRSNADWQAANWARLKGDENYTQAAWSTWLLTDLVLGTNYLSAPDAGGVGPATAANFTSTARNAVAMFMQANDDGSSPESTEYGRLSCRELLTCLYAALATGKVDRAAVADILALVQQWAEWYGAWEFTTDGLQAMQWGNIDWPRSCMGVAMTADSIFVALATLQGITAGTPAGRLVNDTLNLLLSKAAPIGTHWGITTFPALYWYDPYTAQAERPALPAWKYAAGAGILRHRGPDGSLFHCYIGNNLGVTHGPPVLAGLGDTQSYSDEYEDTRVLGYSYDRADQANGILCGGVSSMFARQTLWAGGGDDWAAVVARTWGPPWGRAGTPSFCNNWLLYRVRFAPGWTVYFDVADATPPNPADVAKLWYEQPQLEKAANDAILPVLNGVTRHCPIPPTRQGNNWTWQTAKGKPVTYYVLAPATYQSEVVDETTAKTPGLQWITPGERHYAIWLGDQGPKTVFLRALGVNRPEVPQMLQDATGIYGIQIGNRRFTFGPTSVSSQSL